MPKRKHSPPTRLFRPEADGLETRQMLSGVVTGMDSKGDNWTLTMIGPGTVSVLKQNDANGNPAPLNSATDINSITIGGTDPTKSRLVGTVTPGKNSDGRVFFQNMIGLPTFSEKLPGAGLGLVAINMPGFWLGNTTPISSTATTAPTPASIVLPDGVDTLRIGGVDTTFNRPAALSGATDDSDNIQLGAPAYGGTRIIIDKSISSTQQAPPASGSTTPTTVQHGVSFAVSGRLDLFQANEIDGDATLPPGQFKNENSKATGTGGTLVVSGTPIPTASGGDPLLVFNGVKGAATGQIGDLRVGGNATNLTAIVYDATGNFSGAKVSNFSVGGETNNVMLVAPNGSRNVVFGKGMDNVEIRSHVINTLKANRGALNSNVIVDRSISNAQFGGDVVNSNILAGYAQNYSNITTTVRGSASLFGNTASAPPPQPQNAQLGGGMLVHVAGDVNNGIFAASVAPAFLASATTRVYTNANPAAKTGFGDANQIVLPGGHIGGKVEGKIDNTTVTPGAPNKAFFAQQVTSFAGPVVPPNVPEPPFGGPQQPTQAPGIHNVGKIPTVTLPVPTPTKTTTSATAARSTPKGPAVAKSKA